MRTCFLLSSSLALAACGSSPTAPAAEERGSVREKEAAQVTAARTLTGWDRLFSSPIETVGSINQAGFGLPDYAGSKRSGGYLSQGVERLMSRSAAPSPNTGTASVSGSAPDRVDQISYVLKLNDAEDAATARDRFAQAVGEFLGRAKVGGAEPLLLAIREGRSAQPEVAGLKASVTATPARIDVTFLRPAANRRGS